MAQADTVNRIKQLRAQKGLSQAALGEMVGAHWITISKLERGKIELTQSWMKRIASALSVSEAEILYDRPNDIPVFIEGVLSGEDRGDGILRFYEGGDDFENPLNLQLEISSGSEKHVWIQLVDDKLGPVLHSGDLVRFTYLDHSRIIGEVRFGRLALVEVGKKSPEKLVGFLARATKEGAYKLEMPGGAVLDNLKPTSIAVATMFASLPIIGTSESRPFIASKAI